MAVAETAKLAVELSLDDTKFARSVSRIDRRLGAFSGAVNRNLGRALDTGITFAIRHLTDAFQGGIEALRQDQVVAAQTTAVLKSTGNAAGVTADQVGKLADELSTLNGVQDDVVQGAENVILRFTKISGKLLPRVTQDVLDFAAATGKDAASAAVKFGRALDDPTSGLKVFTREGVRFTAAEEAQIKTLQKHGKLQEAQAIILKKLETRFKGVAKAQADADPSRRLALSVEKLQKAFAKNLLPVVEKVQRKLTDFFNDPQTIAAVQRVGDTIAGLFTDQNLNAVLGGIEIAAKAVGTALSAFNSLPPEIKALAIGAFAINKVTGGAVGGIATAFGKVLGAGLQKIFAANVTVIGGSVTGGAGLPGAVGTAGGASKLAKVGGVVAAVAGIAAVVATQQEISNQTSQQAADLQASLDAGIKVKTPAELQTALNGVKEGINSIQSNPLLVLVQGDALDTLHNMENQLTNALGVRPTSTPSGVDFRAGERASEATTVTGIPKAIISQEQQTRTTIGTLRDRLAAVIKSEAAAQRAGDQGRAARLNAKEDAIRARLATANSQLAAIRAKKTTFITKTTVNVNTSLSVSEIKRQARYTSRVARATQNTVG